MGLGFRTYSSRIAGFEVWSSGLQVFSLGVKFMASSFIASGVPGFHVKEFPKGSDTALFALGLRFSV